MAACIRYLPTCVALAFLLGTILIRSLTVGELVVSLHRFERDGGQAVNMISFCNDCDDPHHEGSIVHGLIPKHGLHEFEVSGEVVYCVPNHAEQKRLLNKHQFRGRIVLVDRGHISLIDKVEKIQKAGASGVIIADDGQCDEEFSFCGSRVGSAPHGGFSPYDDESRWHSLTIPVLMITQTSAERLRRLMRNQIRMLPKIGPQNITILRGHEEL
jgi:hypothetical protein